MLGLGCLTRSLHAPPHPPAPWLRAWGGIVSPQCHPQKIPNPSAPPPPPQRGCSPTPIPCPAAVRPTCAPALFIAAQPPGPAPAHSLHREGSTSPQPRAEQDWIRPQEGEWLHSRGVTRREGWGAKMQHEIDQSAGSDPRAALGALSWGEACAGVALPCGYKHP